MHEISVAIADKGEEELQSGKNEFFAKVACKYYHLRAKNYTRAYYYQKA